MPLLSRVPGEVSESAFVEGPVYVCACVLSHVRLSATPRTIVHQAPLSMGSPRQEYWDGLPFLSPGEGLGEQQSTRPDQLPLHPFPPPSLVHSLFLSIQPLSKAHPCHPLATKNAHMQRLACWTCKPNKAQRNFQPPAGHPHSPEDLSGTCYHLTASGNGLTTVCRMPSLLTMTRGD